jgi:glycosyltransferase involved in cell wall biosynthesis
MGALMRVLAIGSMYPPHYLGGQELVWRRATVHQRQAGHEVRVLTTDYRRDGVGDEEWDDDVHRDLRWYWHDHEFPRMSPRERLALERHNRNVLARHLDELRPDAVIWWAVGGMSTSLLEQVRRTGLPTLGVVCDEWMLYADRVDGWMKLWARTPPLRRAADRMSGIPTRMEPGPAGRWLFISEHIRRRAMKRFELPDTGIAHPGIDAQLFSPRPPRPWAWRIGYVGRIDPRKGIDLAIQALAELPAEATLSIDGGGDDEHLAELRALAAELGLEDRVRFGHAAREALPDAYAAADAIVFPVVWDEPWGLVPIEAMAVGRPVVATARGGSAEYLRDGANCLVFDAAGGPAALAAALHRLAADEPLRRRLREGGFETAAGLHEDTFNDQVLAELEAVGRRPRVDNRAA